MGFYMNNLSIDKQNVCVFICEESLLPRKKADTEAVQGIAKYQGISPRNIVLILFAFSIVLISYFFPPLAGLSHDGQVMLGILLMGAILWISEPIPLAVTGLLIMVIQPILGVMSADQVFASFGNKAVFFLIGAFILAGAIEKHGLHRRIALKFLGFFEHSPRMFTFGIMVSCAFLSFVMPEHGVAALFLPIIVSILLAMKVVPKESNFGKLSMLSVAFGCSIGSLGTLIGGARNPLTVAALSNAGYEVTFVEWMRLSMPVVFIALPLVWLVLQVAFPIEIKDVSSAKKEIESQVKTMGTLGKNEFIVFTILVITICLWVFFSSPEFLGLAVIAIIGSLLLFFTGSISWRDVEERVPWGLILLYGGAITLGIGMEQTGAGAWLAQILLQGVGQNILLLVFVVILVTILLTNVMSNIGAVAILLPFGFALSSQLSLNPVFTSMLIALSGGLAFMLLIATPGNAITYSSGYFSTRDLLKGGGFATCVCIIIVFFVAILYWKGVLGL
jgi:sodium-dependent dicarboxylate transporter 2/3/5